MITEKPLSICDKDVQSFLQHSIWRDADLNIFISRYNEWIHSSDNFKINGLENFCAALTDGVTGAFPDFAHAFPNKPLMVFKGEYLYHKGLGALEIDNPSQLTPGYRLILSVPFSSTGNMPAALDDILARCDMLDIPVFLDFAYFGLCSLPEINVNYQCVKFCAFSLSKTFGTGKCKIGMCYYKDIFSCSMDILTRYSYVNQVSVNLHLPIIQEFSPDYMFNNYRQKQEFIAHELGVEVSDTVIFCTTHNPRFNDYDRQGLINRLGIGNLLTQDKKTILQYKTNLL
jgi:hypothetical protein